MVSNWALEQFGLWADLYNLNSDSCIVLQQIKKKYDIVFDNENMETFLLKEN